MTIAREEIFGPVLSILKFSDYDEVIRRANDSCYGLGAGIVTRSIDLYQKLCHGIRAGTVYVNCYMSGGVTAPFGIYCYKIKKGDLKIVALVGKTEKKY